MPVFDGYKPAEKSPPLHLDKGTFAKSVTHVLTFNIVPKHFLKIRLTKYFL